MSHNDVLGKTMWLKVKIHDVNNLGRSSKRETDTKLTK